MIKEQDILVMAAALTVPAGSTVRAIAAVAGLDVATTHRSLKRLGGARLWSSARGMVDRRNALEFLTHALKYLYPAPLGAIDRGWPAAWGREPLAGMLAPSDSVPVWPDPHGSTRGPVLQPLHHSLSRRDDEPAEFGELVALIDSVRAGDARIRELAVEALQGRLLGIEGGS